MGHFSLDVTDVLRGCSTNYNKNNSQYKEVDTNIWTQADDKASTETNKTAATIMLEDFAEVTRSFKGNRSCITEENTSNGILSHILGKSDNIYKTEEAADYIKENGVFFQSDIYEQEIEANGGVRYASENADIYESALNFAKADISAIETAYNNAYTSKPDKSGQLCFTEINTYYSTNKVGSLKDFLSDMDVDGKSDSITAEEYASYLIAIDGLTSYGEYNEKIDFSSNLVDGLVSTDEVELASNMNVKELQKTAEKIYNKHFAK